MAHRQGLPPLHILLAIAIMAVWGSNFTVIKLGLAHLPPLTFAMLRFIFVAFPLILFLPRPRVSWGNLAAYGLLIGAGQFGLLFTAMRASITPGIASLILQMQVFFTIGLSMWLTGERMAKVQVIALLLASVGLATILAHTDGSATPLGLGLCVTAAFSWGCGNIVARNAVRTDPALNMLAYVVWSAIFAVPPLLAFALVLEGPQAMLAGIASADGATWSAVAWQSVGNTMFGYAAWGWLLGRHPAAQVAPMALMVPIFGLATSALALGMLFPMLKQRFSR